MTQVVNTSSVDISLGVETLIDLHIAQGQFKVVRIDIGGKPDYTILANDEYISSFEVSAVQDVVYEGLARIRELLEHLKLDKDRKVLKSRYKNGAVTNDDEEIGKEISDRDHQSMYNFAVECSFGAIAENYDCSAEYVSGVVDTRPWLHPKPQEREPINMTWWESDHSDPLELVKTFYPECLDEDVPSEIEAKKNRQEMGWKEYYNSVDIIEIYHEGGQGAIDAFHERVKEMAKEEGVDLSDIF